MIIIIMILIIIIIMKIKVNKTKNDLKNLIKLIININNLFNF